MSKRVERDRIAPIPRMPEPSSLQLRIEAMVIGAWRGANKIGGAVTQFAFERSTDVQSDVEHQSSQADVLGIKQQNRAETHVQDGYLEMYESPENPL